MGAAGPDAWRCLQRIHLIDPTDGLVRTAEPISRCRSTSEFMRVVAADMAHTCSPTECYTSGRPLLCEAALLLSLMACTRSFPIWSCEVTRFRGLVARARGTFFKAELSRPTR